jgi:UrcA family protein
LAGRGVARTAIHRYKISIPAADHQVAVLSFAEGGGVISGCRQTGLSGGRNLRRLAMKITHSLTATILGLSATPGFAQSAPTPASDTVRYADLNVASAQGREALARLIAVAADRVCDMPNGQTDLTTRMATKACRTRAIASAMQRFDGNAAPQYASR